MKVIVVVMLAVGCEVLLEAAGCGLAALLTTCDAVVYLTVDFQCFLCSGVVDICLVHGIILSRKYITSYKTTLKINV